MVAAVALLPVVVLLAWMFDVGRRGIVRDPQDLEQTHAGGGDDDDLASMATVVGSPSETGGVVVRWADEDGENAAFFVADFYLGRGSDCRVRFYDPRVSRQHARVYYEDGAWNIRDLGSRNGTIVDGQSISEAALASLSAVQLNEAGPVLRLELVEPGDSTRQALAQFAAGPAVAHVRVPGMHHDRTVGTSRFNS